MRKRVRRCLPPAWSTAWKRATSVWSAKFRRSPFRRSTRGGCGFEIQDRQPVQRRGMPDGIEYTVMRDDAVAAERLFHRRFRQNESPLIQAVPQRERDFRARSCAVDQLNGSRFDHAAVAQRSFDSVGCAAHEGQWCSSAGCLAAGATPWRAYHRGGSNGTLWMTNPDELRSDLSASETLLARLSLLSV